MKVKRIFPYMVIAGILGIFLAGCATTGGTKVSMSYEKYTPSFRTADYRHMKGKRVVLASFHNQAQNTRAWSYQSVDSNYVYEGNAALDSYYWYCFEKAFKHIGVRIVDYETDERHYRRYRHRYGWSAPGPGSYRAPKNVPEFQLILTSLTDQEFKFKVLVFKNGESRLDKEFSVKVPPAGTDDIPALERRAYRLADLAFTKIMKDRDFRRVF